MCSHRLATRGHYRSEEGEAWSTDIFGSLSLSDAKNSGGGRRVTRRIALFTRLLDFLVHRLKGGALWSVVRKPSGKSFCGVFVPGQTIAVRPTAPTEQVAQHVFEE